jgi:hypothetical protein
MDELINANSDEGTTEFHNLESSQSCSSSTESKKIDGGSMSIHNTFYQMANNSSAPKTLKLIVNIVIFIVLITIVTSTVLLSIGLNNMTFA